MKLLILGNKTIKFEHILKAFKMFKIKKVEISEFVTYKENEINTYIEKLIEKSKHELKVIEKSKIIDYVDAIITIDSKEPLKDLNLFIEYKNKDKLWGSYNIERNKPFNFDKYKKKTKEAKDSLVLGF